MIRWKQDLYWCEQHSVDLTELAASCRSITQYASTELPQTHTATIPLIGDSYYNYNLLLYPLAEINRLYHCIQRTFKQIQPGADWWIKCWANLFEQQAHYDWHQHHTHYGAEPSQYPSYHGIFCVQGQQTVTTYHNNTTNSRVHIPQLPNQLTVIENHPDWYHRTWPHKHSETRITVAFNILHATSIDSFKYANHWVPL